MKACYWHGTIPNFGDELNAWLWPRLLPKFFDDDESELFIGIGSVLYHDYPAAARKLVFGSGYGGYSQPPVIDDTWDIFFVRGPRTAAVLGIDGRFGLGDAATLVRHVWDELPAEDRRVAVGFMPHWESTLYGAWDDVCAELGYRYIDPQWPVECVMAAMRGCAVLVTEAMHGAIVADALRVPWVPFMPLPVHRNKWFDWAESQNLDLQFSESAPSTWLEYASFALQQRGRIQRIVRKNGKHLRAIGSSLFRVRAAAALRTAAAARPYLTPDRAIEAKTDAMVGCLEGLRTQYADRVAATR